MNWYHIYQTYELSAVPWQLFKQSVRWNLAATEFILEYINEPADKTGVLSRDAAAAYTKNSDWETYEPWMPLNNGES